MTPRPNTAPLLLSTPDFDWSHNNIGICLFDSDQVSAAIDEYREAIRLRPDFVEAQNNLGNALTPRRALRRSHRRVPGCPRLASGRGRRAVQPAVVLMKAGHRSEAANQLREILKSHPDLPQVQALLEQAQ